MRNTVHNVGTAGIIRDIKPHLLPSEVWSDGRNVRFEPQKVYAMGGVAEAFTKTGLLNAGLVATPTQKYIIYTTAGEVFSWDGEDEVRINRTDTTYNQTADQLFNIQSFNGLGLFNNGVDAPQAWAPTTPGGLMVNLPGWNSVWTAQNIRPFKAFLFALNMTDGVNLQPHKMRWSTPAVPGAMPSSWTAAPTNEAGEFDFPDTDKGILVDGLELGNKFYVYKEGSIWAFTYVGGRSIFSRDQIVDNVGLQVKRSLVNVPFTKSGQKMQFFVGEDNFYMMNGLSVTPVFENVFKNEILRLVNRDRWKKRAFSVVNYRFQEVWFCIPQVGEDFATLAFCLNFSNGTYSIRELSGASNIVSAIGFDTLAGSQQQDLPYNDETFFSDNTGFFNIEVNSGKSVILETSPGQQKGFYLDVGVLDYNQTSEMPVYIMREAMAVIKNDSRNEKADIVDYKTRKLLTHVTPKLYSGSAALTIGTQENEFDPISWLDYNIIPAEDWKYDLEEPISSRFFTFKFSKVEGQSFALAGFDYEIKVLGTY